MNCNVAKVQIVLLNHWSCVVDVCTLAYHVGGHGSVPKTTQTKTLKFTGKQSPHAFFKWNKCEQK